MHKPLLGDTNPYNLFKELANRDFSYLEVLKNEEILSNLYRHNINDGAKIIRTPTNYLSKSWITHLKLEDKLETYVNLAVSKAKQLALPKGVLVAGVLSTGYNLEYLNEKDIEIELNELIILLDDFMVDFIIIQNISNVFILNKVVALCSKLSNLPIAPFLLINNNCEDIESKLTVFKKIAKDYQLELCGFECSSRFLNNIKNWESITPKGIILNETQQILKNKLKDLFFNGFLVALAGNNTNRNQWKSILNQFIE